jgi:hypothetical protein
MGQVSEEPVPLGRSRPALTQSGGHHNLVGYGYINNVAVTYEVVSAILTFDGDFA